MRIIGVIDLLGGHAVRARGGVRAAYQPVTEVADAVIPSGDALALAQTYLARCGIAELYVADLDAILAHQSDTTDGDRRGAAPHRRHDAQVAAIAALGSPLWLDAAIAAPADAGHAIALGASRVIVGLETLGSYAALERIGAVAGIARVAFSLDLRHGVPILTSLGSDGLPPGEPAEAVAARAVETGVGAVIVLDLARVGSGAGFDLALIERVRAAVPEVMLLAGGGARGREDLRRLADAGCDGALVATALQDGRLDAAAVVDLARVGGYRSTSR